MGKGALVSMSIVWSSTLRISLIVADVALHVRAVARGALVAEDHVVGRERRAVVELHALAQVEAPDRGRGLLPARWPAPARA